MEVSSQLHASAALPPGLRARDTHWIGDWVDSRAGLDPMEISLLQAVEAHRVARG
jgi:hypothetical protein